MIKQWDKLTRWALLWLYFAFALVSIPFIYFVKIISKYLSADIISLPPHSIKNIHKRLLSNDIKQVTDKTLPFISVILPVYNAESTLALCLESLKRQTWPSNCYEIILVDNQSTDRSRQIAQEFDVTIVRCETKGAAAARNAGIESARGKWVALIDSDCIASPYWLERWADDGISLSEKNPNIRMYGGLIKGIYPKGKSHKRFGNDIALLDQKSAIEGTMLGSPYVITANALLHRETFIERGMFDTELRWCEDVDLGWNYIANNFEMVYVPEALVWHIHRTSFVAIHDQFCKYGISEVAVALKWQALLSPALLSQLIWFRPHQYRLFWKNSFQLIVAILLLRFEDATYHAFTLAAYTGHTAGHLIGNWRCKNSKHLSLFPELINDNEK